MEISVRCRCNVVRQIDTTKVGQWRLRCKQCGDVLYDPSSEDARPEAQGQHASHHEEEAHSDLSSSIKVQEFMTRKLGPSLRESQKMSIYRADEDDEESRFQQWLLDSRELRVTQTADTGALTCDKHPKGRVVAACTRCSRLLCKQCLDRIEDEFACAECVAKVVNKSDRRTGSLTTWFKKLFSGSDVKKVDNE